MEKILDLFLEVYPSIISIMFHRISIKLIVWSTLDLEIFCLEKFSRCLIFVTVYN